MDPPMSDSPMSDSPATTPARRLWHVVRAVCYMLRKGVSKHKFMLDLHLLLDRGKLAGKAIAGLLSSHHHHNHHHTTDSSSFSCRYMDPATSFYNPREVEFSCSNTPAYTAKRRHRRRHHDRHYDAAAIARVFDLLNQVSEAEPAVASPSPGPTWTFGKSPAVGRQLRITDSPFPVRAEAQEEDGVVDEDAEEFINKFYEQLRLQPAATPDYGYRRRAPVLGRA